jgi:hypothetical protein
VGQRRQKIVLQPVGVDGGIRRGAMRLLGAVQQSGQPRNRASDRDEQQQRHDVGGVVQSEAVIGWQEVVDRRSRRQRCRQHAGAGASGPGGEHDGRKEQQVGDCRPEPRLDQPAHREEHHDGDRGKGIPSNEINGRRNDGGSRHRRRSTLCQ